jgi:hypothetical protein
MNQSQAITAALRGEIELRYYFLHLATAIRPDLLRNSDLKLVMQRVEGWANTAPAGEIATQAPAMMGIFDAMIGEVTKIMPLKKDWKAIAAEHRDQCRAGTFSFTSGLPCWWILERFERNAVRIPEEIPFHARIGVGPHSGRASVEEDFLLRDAYFMLAKCKSALDRLESVRGKTPRGNDSKAQYEMVSGANQNVATYARSALSGFYAFVECFVNSVGEDFVMRNAGLASPTKELLRGRKDGRYLSLERKIELFPGLMRADGKRPIVISDPAQVAEPYRSFVTHVKEVRDASAHYGKQKADIIMSPQMWAKKAADAAVVCTGVARGFWEACYPGRAIPKYVDQLQEARLLSAADERVTKEFLSVEENPQ